MQAVRQYLMDHWQIFMKLTLGNWNVIFYELRAKEKLDQISERSSKIISSDYVLNTYIDDTTATFPTLTWSEVPSLVRRNNNGPKAFHSHYNEQFYKSHLSMFIFMDTLTKLQAITYVKLRSTNAETVCTRKEFEKEQFLIEKYSKLMSGDITRQQFVFAVSYKNQPLVK